MKFLLITLIANSTLRNGKQLLIILVGFTTCQLYGQQVDSTRYSWRIEDLFESEDAWRIELNQFSERDYYKGINSIDSANDLYDFCVSWTKLLSDYQRLSVYIILREKSQEQFIPDSFRQRLNLAASEQFGATGQFIEMLNARKAKIIDYLDSSKDLFPYKTMVSSFLEKNEIEMDSIQQAIVEVAKGISTYTQDYTIVSRNIEFPEIQLASGEKLAISVETDYRQFDNRSDREKIYRAKYGTRAKWEDLFANMYLRKLGHFKVLATSEGISPIDYLLKDQSIPTAYYDTFIKAINENLSIHHRYLRLMAQMLDLDTLQSWDIEVVPKFQEIPEYPIDSAITIFKNALTPFGENYTEVIERAKNNRWIDINPKPYSIPTADYAHGSHPYVSTIYSNTYTNMRSLGHELGHAIEMELSSQNLPYPIFYLPPLLVEVPSTINELLINDYLLKTGAHVDTYVLCQYLFYLNGTLFSNALNADVDYQLFTNSQNLNGLKADQIKAIYLQTRRKYFGEAEGISTVSDLDVSNIANRWFIMEGFRLRWFTYAIGSVIAANIKEGLQSGRLTSEDYLTLITTGELLPATEILAKLDIDLSKVQSYDPIFEEINILLDRLEAQLD